MRILSYAGDYLDTTPTLDRVGESVEKLLEDMTGRPLPPYGDRHAFVRFGTPVRIADYVGKGCKLRDTVRDLTTRFEQGVQAELDTINASNSHPGAKPFAGGRAS